MRSKPAELTSQELKDTTATLNKTKQTLPRVTLSWKPNQGSNFYVTYAEGVQPLQLNSGFVQATPAQRAFLQAQFPGITEYSILPTLESFEIGAKQSLLDGRLQYTVALYDSKWKNRTTLSSVFNPASCAYSRQSKRTIRCSTWDAGMVNLPENSPDGIIRASIQGWTRRLNSWQKPSVN